MAVNRSVLHTLYSSLLYALLMVPYPTYAATGNEAEYSENFVNVGGLMLSTEAPNIQDVNPICMYELLKLLNESAELVPVLDSFGKPASGILVGNFAWLGNFDQCMAVEGFRHCLIGMGANFSVLLNVSVVLPIQWGVCVPEVCTEEDVRDSLELLLDFLRVSWLNLKNLDSSSVYCTDKPNTNFDVGFILSCVFMSTLVALTIVGSMVDYYMKYRASQANRSILCTTANGSSAESSKAGNLYDQLAVDYQDENEINHEDVSKNANSLTEKTPLLSSGKPTSSTTVLSVDIKHERKPNILVKLLLCFAISRNLPKFLNPKQVEGSIQSLNGIRVISISWVILGHSLVFIVSAQVNENTLPFVDRWFHNFTFQALANAFLSVDTFFFLSGTLLAFHTLKKLKETGGKLPWHWFYIHRYIRLTPALALLILVLTFVLPNLNQGPVWFRVDRTVNWCKSYWWTDLLYINNFVPDGQKDCISWAWYLANDMQFFVISPIFILLLFWFPILGCLALAVTFAVSFIVTASIVYKNDFPPSFFLATTGFFVRRAGSAPSFNLDYQKLVYVKPYCRIPPYLVGMAMGYFLYKMDNRKQQVKLSPVLAAAGWAIASALGIAVVYGLYDVNSGATIPTLATSIAFNGLSTMTWAVALCWVVFACQYGYGGIVNDFLSWSFWVPLSRLTYSTYLFHPVVIYIYSYGQTVPFHLSLVNLIYMFASFLLLAHLVALVVTLALEFPIGNLEKMLREGLTPKKQVKEQGETKT